MRALRLVGLEAADLSSSTSTSPEPGGGPGEVRHTASVGAGACHSDLHLMYDFEGGLLPWGPPIHARPRHAGWVDALGPGTSGVAGIGSGGRLRPVGLRLVPPLRAGAREPHRQRAGSHDHSSNKTKVYGDAVIFDETARRLTS